MMSTDIIDFYDEKLPFYEFSNFYRPVCPLMHEGKSYQTSEHLYQSLKFRGPNATSKDLQYAEVVRNAKSPTQCKLLAAQHVGGGYDWRTALNPTIQKSIDEGVKIRADWEEVKFKIMEGVLMVKFTQNSFCRDKLLSTGDKTLCEHTERDSVWGTGGSRRHGQNQLGKALMRVRTVLRAKKEEEEKKIDKKRKVEEKEEEGEVKEKEEEEEEKEGIDEEEEKALLQLESFKRQKK